MNSIIVESKVPFDRPIYAWLRINHLPLEKLAQHDLMEQSYLAWETVRKQTNPFFESGTGFEGYFVSRCQTPEAALEEILTMSQHILDSIARLYRFEYNFRTRLMHTLTGDTGDLSTIPIWSAYLGAELGKLRAQILGNYKAQVFQQQTYRIVSTLPPISYHMDSVDITQTYAVGGANKIQPGKLYITLEMLKPCQQDAWLVAENIGQFGHPLVRRYISHDKFLSNLT